MKKNIEKLWELIKNSKKILLINHVNMDPDAFGSLWAFYYILQKINKEVKAVNDSMPSEQFSFLNSSEIIETDLDIEKYNPDLIIAFDSGTESKLWETYKKYKKIFLEKNFVVIDHHETNKWYWTLNIINYVSSTCEIVFSILKQLWLDKHITKKEATLLTAWIHSDTNVFYNINTSPNTLRIAAELMELWADFRIPMYNFYHKISYDWAKFYWRAFNKIQKNKNWKIVWCKITKKDFLETNCTEKSIFLIKEKIINIDWAEIAFIIYETWEKTKITFRSQSYDVWKLCSKYPGWWWHKLSAWFLSDKNIDEIEKEILEKLKDLN